MKALTFYHLVSAGCVDTRLPIEVTLPSWPVSDFSLRIVHWNDLHSHVESGPRLRGPNPEVQVHGYSALAAAAYKAAVAGARDGEIPLIIDAGDSSTGTVWSSFYKGIENAELLGMGRSGVMVSTFGEHEFDYGPAAAAEFVKQHGGPFVSCNMDWSRERSWDLVTQVHRHVIREVPIDHAGTMLRIGFIGTTTRSTPKKSNSGSILFEEELSALPRCIAGAKAAGAHIIILISHSGMEVDTSIAFNSTIAPSLFGIIGAHSHILHSNMQHPEITEQPYPSDLGVRKISGGVFRVESYYKGTFFGHGRWRGSLWIAKPTSVVRGDSHLVLAEDHCSIPIDVKRDEMAGLVEEFRGQPVGNVTVELMTSSNPWGEVSFGNLICDAFVWHRKEADMAIKITGGMRRNIYVGEATNEIVIDALPPGGFLFAGTCPGETIKDILMVSGFRLGTPDFLQIGGEGVFVWYNDNRTIKEATIGGIAIEKIPSINIVIGSTITEGWAGFVYNFEDCDLSAIGGQESEVVSAYMSHLGTVDYQGDGRLIVGEISTEETENTETETSAYETIPGPTISSTTSGPPTTQTSEEQIEESKAFALTSSIAVVVLSNEI